MLTYDLEKRGKKPLYEYLYYCIREDILQGNLKAGEKLPSKREMAGGYGIALITVENAYAQLIIEGYVTAKEKRGYFVNRVALAEAQTMPKNATPTMQKSTPENSSASGRQSAAAAAASSGRQSVQEAQASPPAWIDLSSSNLRRDAFPFATWTRLMRRIMEDREEAFLRKPESTGVPELREAISEYLRKAKGLSVTPDRIVVGPGTEYLHHLILQLVGPSRIVAVEDPGYKKVGQIYEAHGLKCLHVPVDENGLIAERLVGSNAKLVHLSPSHHFPTGCVMPIGRRRSLLSWAQAEGAYLVEDDYDSEFRFDGRPVPTLASLNDEVVIYMNTFTKTLAPSIRIAFMVLPAPLLQRFQEKLFFYSGAVSSFEQYTLAAFLKDGYYERHVNRMRNYYRQQRTKILQALSLSPLSERVTLEEHGAGLHFIVKVRGIRDDEKWLDRLAREGIRLSPVSAYCYGGQEKYRHKFLIYYGDIDEESMKRAFEIMART
ncbi:MAG: PLP-dependent aminotransferase family protein [Lachnospiraceae bacterium]|nr:PLP-dependent aminotransferase family protein [Lachnospiraceae bacterium]